jgi:probable HAF family extracellular repeat protein
MKSRLQCFATVTLFAALAIPVRLAAQEQKEANHRYKLIDTRTLGGPNSSLGFEGERDINNSGALVSLVELSTLSSPPFCFSAGPPPDCHVGHAAEWKNGVLADLGALGVGGSGPVWISDSGLISGLSQNGVIDPLTGQPELKAVLWKHGQIIDLGTLGGTQSLSGAVNDRGQVVGCATNAIPDPFSTCSGVPLSTQSRAFLWENGVMQDLGTLGGPDANAGLVNEEGQVAGWSFTDSIPNPSTGIPTQHPFLWEKGKMLDLGTLGGTAVFGVNSLNNRGEVVGGMTLAGDQSFHPFLWDGQALRNLGTLGGNFGIANWVNETGDVAGWATKQGDQVALAFLWSRGVMTGLGVLPGDACSIAYAINSNRQIVGSSDDCSGNNAHAFVWEKGSLIDLNTVVPAASGVLLTVALSINERGEIAAQGVLPNGDLHAFLLMPCDDDYTGTGSCGNDTEGTNAMSQNNPAFADHGPTPVMQGSLTPSEKVAAFRARVTHRYLYHGVGVRTGK